MKKILLYMCCALPFFTALAACSADDSDKAMSNDGHFSATYVVSGRVVDEEGAGLLGIIVELQSDGVALDDGLNCSTVSGTNGKFEVEVRSSKVKGEKLEIRFTDPRGDYDDATWSKQLDNVEFINGNYEELYKGMYRMTDVEQVMKRKGSGEEPEEPEE